MKRAVRPVAALPKWTPVFHLWSREGKRIGVLALDPIEAPDADAAYRAAKNRVRGIVPEDLARGLEVKPSTEEEATYGAVYVQPNRVRRVR